MAIVPTVKERQVKPRPIHQQYFNVSVDPDAFGAGIGRAIEGFGAAVSDVGAAQARLKSAEATVLAGQADNNFSDWIRDYLYNEETGYLNKLGANAWETREEADAEIEAARKRFGVDLKDEASKRYLRASEKRQQVVEGQVIRHSAKEFRNTQDAVQKSRFENLQDGAVAAGTDARVRAEYLEAGADEWKAWGDSRGWPKEVIDSAHDQWLSATRKKIILSLVPSEPLEAMLLFNAVKNTMRDEDRQAIETSSLGRALRKSGMTQEILDEMGLGAKNNAAVVDYLTGGTLPPSPLTSPLKDEPKDGVAGEGESTIQKDGVKPIVYKKGDLSDAGGRGSVGSGGQAPDGTPITKASAGSARRQAVSTPPYMRGRTKSISFLKTRTNKGAAAIEGFKNGFANNLANFIVFSDDEIGKGLEIFSGYRSPAYQAVLFKRAVKKYGSVARARKWVAPPGRSRHGFGIAADLMWNGQRLDRAPKRIRNWVHANSAVFGLTFRMSWEPWHIEFDGKGNPIDTRIASASGGGRLRVPKVRVDPPSNFVENAQHFADGTLGSGFRSVGVKPAEEVLDDQAATVDDDDTFIDAGGAALEGDGSDPSAGAAAASGRAGDKGDFLGDYQPGFGYTVEASGGQDRVSDFSNSLSNTKVLEFINSIEDPILRLEYMEIFRDIEKNRATSVANHEKAVRAKIERMVMENKADQVSEEDWVTGGTTFRNDMDNYMERLKEEKMDLVMSEILKAASDPKTRDAWLHSDLSGIIADVSKEDYNYLLKLQKDGLAGVFDEFTKLNSMKAIYDTILRGAGIIKTDMNETEWERLANFERVIMERINAFEKTENRAITAMEISDIVYHMMTPVVLDYGVWSNTEGFRFEIRKKGVPGEVVTNMTIDKVPQAYRAAIVRKIQELRPGEPVSSDAVAKFYGDWLLDRSPGDKFE